jgi:hypothetical protein
MITVFKLIGSKFYFLLSELFDAAQIAKTIVDLSPSGDYNLPPKQHHNLKNPIQVAPFNQDYELLS